jgi:hypothetical protein
MLPDKVGFAGRRLVEGGRFRIIVVFAVALAILAVEADSAAP